MYNTVCDCCLFQVLELTAESGLFARRLRLHHLLAARSPLPVPHDLRAARHANLWRPICGRVSPGARADLRHPAQQLRLVLPLIPHCVHCTCDCTAWDNLKSIDIL